MALIGFLFLVLLGLYLVLSTIITVYISVGFAGWRVIRKEWYVPAFMFCVGLGILCFAWYHKPFSVQVF